MIIEQGNWRVIEGDYTVPQWVLQRGKGDKWTNTRYCQTRKALIRDFKRALRGEHDDGEDMTPETLNALRELPARIDG